MLPAGDGFIHLGPHDRRFGVTMFHQLQCLDVIRQALTDTQGGDANELIHHCMNYLRQMALCHSHTALESVRADKPPKIVDLTRSMYECRDWTALYKGAEANHLRRESVDSFGGSRQLTYRCNPEKSRGKQEWPRSMYSFRIGPLHIMDVGDRSSVSVPQLRLRGEVGEGLWGRSVLDVHVPAWFCFLVMFFWANHNYRPCVSMPGNTCPPSECMAGVYLWLGLGHISLNTTDRSCSGLSCDKQDLKHILCTCVIEWIVQQRVLNYQRVWCERVI